MVAVLGNFINRVLVLLHKYFDGIVPKPSDYHIIDEDLVTNLKKLIPQIEKNIAAFNLKEALQSCMELARIGNKYLAETQPWIVIKSDKNRVCTILNRCIQIVANLTIILYPFLPTFSKNLNSMISDTDSMLNWDLAGNIDIIKEGTKLKEPRILFEKIDDDAINAQLEKLRAMEANIL